MAPPGPIDRWLRSEADPFFWSDQTETLDTPHFHVIYFIEDRNFVRPVVDQLEKARESVCADLGCSFTPLTYTLNLNTSVTNGWPISDDGREIRFASPRIIGMIVTIWTQAAAKIGRNVLQHNREQGFLTGPNMHDPLAVAIGLEPAIIKQAPHLHVDIETEGEFTAGASAVDRRNFFHRPPNARVCLEVDSDLFRELFWQRAVTATPDKKAVVAPAGRFNTGQKINACLVMVYFLGFAATGTLMHLKGVVLLPWYVHAALFFASLNTVGGHLFLSRVNPSTRVSLPGIFHG